MRKHILLLGILALLISCKAEEESKQEEQPQELQQADTIAETPQPVVEGCDTIEPAHLYKELRDGQLLMDVMLYNSSGLIRQVYYEFAGEYCRNCEITVGKSCWESEELCSEWLTSRFGKGWYGKINLKEFISYLDYGVNEKYAKQFPDREKTKRQIVNYCKNDYFPKFSTLDSCLEKCFFDYNAFDFKFDGYDNPIEWTEKYWKKYVDIEVVSWQPDCSLATDTSMTYFVIYKYKFHKSKRGGFGGNDILCRARLTEYNNGTYEIEADDPNM